MTIRSIHQFVHSFVPRDAIGVHVMNLKQVLQELGIDSDIYCLESKDSYSEIAKDYKSYRSTNPKETAVIYHLSTGSPVADFVAELADYKIVNYHNITPPKFFSPWEPHVGVELTRGRQQLQELASLTHLGIGDSLYNASEMTDMGYKDVVVAPVMMNIKDQDNTVELSHNSYKIENQNNSQGTNWLFVGRIAPNKCQQDVIKAFFVYRKLYDPLAKLYLVGGYSSHAYWRALQRFVTKLDLDSSVKLTGAISDQDLESYYKTTDVFVCLSQHEGFCVPLIEAMKHQIPIVSLDSSAIGETLLDGGLLLKNSDPFVVASAVDRVTTDINLKSSLIKAGQTRAKELSLENSQQKYKEVMANFIASHNLDGSHFPLSELS